MGTSEAECLEALREAAQRLGKSPTKVEYEELGITPSSSTIRRIVGGWNEAKERADLETFSQAEAGGTEVQEKPDWVEIPEGTEWEALTGQQRWYYKNRRDRIERKDRRRQELRRWLHEMKQDELACRRCGEGRPPALDFHHTEEAKKELSISQMISYGYSKQNIAEEIEECTVLCANCHRVEHYEPPLLPSKTDNV
jgi:hypothetical protein